jgi:hypothetical protein
MLAVLVISAVQNGMGEGHVPVVPAGAAVFRTCCRGWQCLATVGGFGVDAAFMSFYVPSLELVMGCPAQTSPRS